MEYDTRTYFVEHEESQVKGFTIIDTNEGEYHLAEKWNKDDGSGSWLQYYITADSLQSRVEQGLCEKKATLTDEQFEKVCSNIEHDKVVA